MRTNPQKVHIYLFTLVFIFNYHMVIEIHLMPKEFFQELNEFDIYFNLAFFSVSNLKEGKDNTGHEG